MASAVEVGLHGVAGHTPCLAQYVLLNTCSNAVLNTVKAEPPSLSAAKAELLIVTVGRESGIFFIVIVGCESGTFHCRLRKRNLFLSAAKAEYCWFSLLNY
jgi:hypothetical protein